jgi:two-component system, chemotaxis family, sensor kinase CheA
VSTSAAPARLIRVFLSELDERLNDFDADLNALAGPSPDADRAEVVTRLFRGAHSLKGAAASIGASGIELVCQQLEDVLAKMRDGALELDAARSGMLVAAAAELRDAGRKLAAEVAPAATPAPPPKPSATAPANAMPRTVSTRVHVNDNTLRVPADSIDTLLEQSGELLASHHRISDLVREVDEAGNAVQRMHMAPAGGGRKRHREELRDLHASLERIATSMHAERTQLQRAAAELDEGIRSIRLLPFGETCAGLDRVAHDVAQATGKHVRLEIGGAEVGIDRVIADRLRDPLVHLIRNAIDHGIESPEERVRAGKPAEGTVRVALLPKLRSLEVRVTDDGRGLNRDQLRRRVRERGIELSEDELPQAVFLPGVSTAASVTHLSGRGVGLDVVRAEVEAMSGSVDVESSPNGTAFVLNLPLTITTYRVMLVSIGTHTFGLNLTSIDRVIRIDPSTLASVEGRQVLLLDNGVIPLVPLAAVIGAEPSAEAPQIALILRRGAQGVALAVDGLIDEREIYLRTLGPRLQALPLLSGAAIGTDGSIALILRTSMVVERALEMRFAHVAVPASDSAPAAKRVLLVDDSITTRTLERSILEAAGYEVLTAADGAAAWTLLGEQTVDLVVTDVDMPYMNGFALVEAVRASATLRELPVILVTARDDEGDRQRGLEIGADAYIVKSSFRQEELLDAIGSLT